MADDLGRADRFLGYPGSASWSSTPSARSGSISRSIGSSAAVSAAIHSAPAADPRQQPRVRPDRERDDGRHQQEEGDRQPGGAGEPAATSRAISARHRAELQLAPFAGERLMAGREHGAASRAMGGDRARPALGRRGPARSVARRAAIAARRAAITRASRARVAWPGRQQPDRDVGQMVEPSATSPRLSRGRPRTQRAAERQFAVERQLLRRPGAGARARPGLHRAAAGRRRAGSGSTCRCRWGR